MGNKKASPAITGEAESERKQSYLSGFLVIAFNSK
jgi:hypothetical protein